MRRAAARGLACTVRARAHSRLLQAPGEATVEELEWTTPEEKEDEALLERLSQLEASPAPPSAPPSRRAGIGPGLSALRSV